MVDTTMQGLYPAVALTSQEVNRQKAAAWAPLLHPQFAAYLATKCPDLSGDFYGKQPSPIQAALEHYRTLSQEYNNAPKEAISGHRPVVAPVKPKPALKQQARDAKVLPKYEPGWNKPWRQQQQGNQGREAVRPRHDQDRPRPSARSSTISRPGQDKRRSRSRSYSRSSRHSRDSPPRKQRHQDREPTDSKSFTKSKSKGQLLSMYNFSPTTPPQSTIFRDKALDFFLSILQLLLYPTRPK